jgi:hypothetical protein
LAGAATVADTGDLDLYTGDAAATDSGDILLTTGAAGGARGGIDLDALDLTLIDDMPIVLGAGRDFEIEWINAGPRLDIVGLNVADGTSGALRIDTGDSTSVAGVRLSGQIVVQTGTSTAANNNGGATGALTLESGDSDVTSAHTGGATGAVRLASGDSDSNNAGATGGASGAVVVQSGDAASTLGTSGASGALNLETGDSADGNTGAIVVQSGAPGAALTSGNISLVTGSTAGAGTAGSIYLTNGTTVLGNRGGIFVDSPFLRLATTSPVLDNTAAEVLLAHDDVLTFADPADTTKRARVDCGNVTAGQTRVLTAADRNQNLAQMDDTTIADPGNGNAIAVLTNGVCAMTSAGAETRTLADPGWMGQRITLVCDTYIGDIVVTAANRINAAGNLTMTFGVVADCISLVGVTIGGNLRWQVTANDGVALA